MSEARDSSNSLGFTEVIARAVTDPEFRHSLYADRETAIAGYLLSAGDIEALNAIPEEMLAGHSVNRSEAATPMAIRIMIGVSGHFNEP